MNGKSYSTPIGMIFKKYYCPHCGTWLMKEQTHREVTIEDKDYYQYHDRGTFPRRDYDVYSYQFRCPSCCKRISYEEQLIFERIQKKYKTKCLSPSCIKENYHAARQQNNKRAFLHTLLFPAFALLVFFTLYYLFAGERTPDGLSFSIVMFVASTVFSTFMAVRRYRGSHKLRMYQGYSHEQKLLFTKLYAYRHCNRETISRSRRCYCFRCQKAMEPGQIKEYIDDGKTALCPSCSFACILADAIDEALDEAIITEMHNYWF